MKQAQLAVETMLIYAVVILIVLLGIGALIRTGVLDLGSLFPDQCRLDNGFTCENYLITEDEVKLELTNRFGTNVEKFHITIYGEGGDTGLWDCETALYDDIVFQGSITDPPVSIPCDVKVPSGKKIQGVILSNVTLVGSKIPRTVKGSIRATVS